MTRTARLVVLGTLMGVVATACGSSVATNAARDGPSTRLANVASLS